MNKMKPGAAINAANGFSRSLEQIETALVNDDLYSGELVVLIAATTTTQDKLRNLLPRLITRLAAVAAEEKEAATLHSRTTAPWANEPDRKIKRS